MKIIITIIIAGLLALSFERWQRPEDLYEVDVTNITLGAL